MTTHESLVALLRDHADLLSAARGVERCACGESAVGEPGWHRHHLASVLEEREVRIRESAYQKGRGDLARHLSTLYDTYMEGERP